MAPRLLTRLRWYLLLFGIACVLGGSGLALWAHDRLAHSIWEGPSRELDEPYSPDPLEARIRQRLAERGIAPTIPADPDVMAAFDLADAQDSRARSRLENFRASGVVGGTGGASLVLLAGLCFVPWSMVGRSFWFAHPRYSTVVAGSLAALWGFGSAATASARDNDTRQIGVAIGSIGGAALAGWLVWRLGPVRNTTSGSGR